jgi:hypothetical protein
VGVDGWIRILSVGVWEEIKKEKRKEKRKDKRERKKRKEKIFCTKREFDNRKRKEKGKAL